MKVNFSKNALKELKKLDNSISIKILKKLKEIEGLDNPLLISVHFVLIIII
ncbi:hypothetical protein [Campylobacter sp. RM16190]|uniref:type II toxin-antitoxin system RelE family toxin n=1 Tax=Campylobacter sp. RM16190 TaxID=1705727 RepID=UPI001473E43A|nr:hypothetical protein [Campylobacter sp. RM16190]